MNLYTKIKEKLYSFIIRKMLDQQYYNWIDTKDSRLNEIRAILSENEDSDIHDIISLMDIALSNILGDYNEDAFEDCMEELEASIVNFNNGNGAERSKAELFHESEQYTSLLLELSDIAKSAFCWPMSEMGYKLCLTRIDPQRQIENYLHCCFALTDHYMFQAKTREAIDILQKAFYQSQSTGFLLGEVISLIRLLALRNLVKTSDPFINVDDSSEMLYKELKRLCDCDIEKLIRLVDTEFASIYSTYGPAHPMLLHAVLAKQELEQSRGYNGESAEEYDEEDNMTAVIQHIPEAIGKLSAEEIRVISTHELSNEALLRYLMGQYLMVLPELSEEDNHGIVLDLTKELDELAAHSHSSFVRVLSHYVKAMYYLSCKNDVANYEKEYDKAMKIIDHSHRLADVHTFKLYFNSVVQQLIFFMNDRKDLALEIIESHICRIDKHDPASRSWYINLLNEKLNYLDPISDEWSNTAREVMQEARTDIMGRFHYLSNNQRSLLLSVWQEKTKFIVNHHTNAIAIDTYNLLSLEKGILMTTSRELKKLLQQDVRYNHLRDMLVELEQCEHKLSLHTGYRTTTESENLRMKYLELNAELFKLDDLGLAGILEFSVTHLQSLLGEGEVVVDFHSYETEDNDMQYLAYIITSNSPIQRVQVCRESELMRFANAFEGEPWRLYDNTEMAYEFCALLWSRLPMNENMTVFFSPTGSLLKISMENLVVDASGRTLSDCFANMIRISHPRYIRNMKKEHTISFDTIEKAVFGNMNYGEQADGDFPILGYAFNTDEGNAEGVLNPWGNLSRNTECDNISYMFNTMPKTTKEEFLALDNSAVGLLHVMTHGFFFGLKTVRHLPKFGSAVDEMDTSGLVFEGANGAWTSEDDIWDGILRSSEIAHMNLSNVKLAVLSVCDSANGVIDRDGLMGLQRALKQAGVNTIIHSLWEVDVETSQRFTFTFYRNLQRGMDKHKAFKDTLNKIKQETVTSRCYPNSYYYARYIMID